MIIYWFILPEERHRVSLSITEEGKAEAGPFPKHRAERGRRESWGFEPYWFCRGKGHSGNDGSVSK